MRKFVPTELNMHYGKSNKQRLVYYVKDFEENEIEKLKEFKEYCKNKGVRIPTRDVEIIRWLHGKKFNIDKAYNAIVAKKNF